MFYYAQSDSLQMFLQKAQQTASTRREFHVHLKEMVEQGTPAKEMIDSCKEEMKKSELPEDDVAFLVGNIIYMVHQMTGILPSC